MQEKPELGPGVGSRVLDTLALPKVRKESPSTEGLQKGGRLLSPAWAGPSRASSWSVTEAPGAAA